ncbi:MAG TPA: metal-sulfur cluster assembly factor [Rhizobium sp.]|uniref:metal-sulfur cluster assembly factor n=1 Tax=Rhizobium sp. F40D2 TaxID=3453141 RepID=UPI002C450D26|nr:metal-sulfur cluster assembly factor [Rhizobium sp.]
MLAPKASKSTILAALRAIEDPELGTDVVALGLVYGIEISDDGAVRIEMTTTTRFCPASAFLAEAVKARTEGIDGVSAASVDLVYEPAWSPEMMGRLPGE